MQPVKHALTPACGQVCAADILTCGAPGTATAAGLELMLPPPMALSKPLQPGLLPLLPLPLVLLLSPQPLLLLSALMRSLLAPSTSWISGRSLADMVAAGSLLVVEDTCLPFNGSPPPTPAVVRSCCALGSCPAS